MTDEWREPVVAWTMVPSGKPRPWAKRRRRKRALTIVRKLCRGGP